MLRRLISWRIIMGGRSAYKRATMLYFANVFLIYFFMAALFSGPGERRYAKVLHVVDLECH